MWHMKFVNALIQLYPAARKAMNKITGHVRLKPFWLKRQLKAQVLHWFNPRFLVGPERFCKTIVNFGLCLVVYGREAKVYAGNSWFNHWSNYRSNAEISTA